MAETISPEDALERMEDDDYMYVDVRSVPEFEGGHPEGAYNVPWKHMGASGMTDNTDFLAVMKAAFGLDAKLIIACKKGGRSKAAASALEAAGFTQVLDQSAGFSGSTDAFGQMKDPGWQTQGLPIAIEAEAGRTWEELKAKI